jgi:hypothetical protein
MLIAPRQMREEASSMTTATEIFTASYQADEDHSWFEASIEHMGLGVQGSV